MPAPLRLSRPRYGSADELLAGLEWFGRRPPRLDTTRALLAALGEPQRLFATVLVAGTNGKGSTAALLASIAAAGPYRTGLYTSPHLESVTERLRLDGRPIADRELADLVAEVLDAAGGAGTDGPTYFEALTVAACLWFARRGVEIAVLEVGLGGRLDATNAVEPVLSLVSDIDLDHTRHLGSSLAEIAREKAGILRRGRPALETAGAEAAAVLGECAEAIGARLRPAGDGVGVRTLAPFSWRGTEVELSTARERYRTRLPLAGRHQLRNLVLAVAAAEELAAGGWERIDRRAVERGVAECRWPARLERLEISPRSTVLLDAAHNPAGVRALCRFLDDLGGGFDLLFGTLAEKDAAAMLGPLVERAERVTLTLPPSGRAAPLAVLAAIARRPGVRTVEDPLRALDVALARLPRRLVVCGSIYLLGAVRPRLRRRARAQPRPV